MAVRFIYNEPMQKVLINLLNQKKSYVTENPTYAKLRGDE